MYDTHIYQQSGINAGEEKFHDPPMIGDRSLAPLISPLAISLGLMALVADEVEMAGPCRSGSGSGSDVRDWVQKSGIRLDPGQTWSRGDAIVVEIVARWPKPGRPDPDAFIAPATVATAFQIEDGRITRLLRFDPLAPALQISGLTEVDSTA